MVDNKQYSHFVVFIFRGQSSGSELSISFTFGKFLLFEELFEKKSKYHFHKYGGVGIVMTHTFGRSIFGGREADKDLVNIQDHFFIPGNS